MRLNTLKPARGAKRRPKRPGRGPGSGIGKTGGRGQKGQKSRAGGGSRRGFEGGQMPLHRRLPKVGFASLMARYAREVRLDAIARVEGDTVDLDAVKAAGLVRGRTRRVKIIARGELGRALTVKGLGVTRGARAAIEAAGGSIEESGGRHGA